MAGPRLSAMAWRNLWRNRRRTVLTLASIAFGTVIAVLFTGLGDANFSRMIDLAARLGGGHVTVQHPEYLDLPSLARTVRDTPELRAELAKQPGVTRAVSRVAGMAMLATARDSQGVAFVAIDPQAETTDTFAVLDQVVAGEMLPGRTGQGVVLGHKLAGNLGLKLGQKVVYTMTDRQGEIVSGLARVSGLLKTGSPTVDGGLCLLPIDAVREALGYAADEATLVGVFLADNRDSEAVARSLDAALGPGVAVHPWFEAQPDLSSFITMKVSSTEMFELFILLLVAAGIFNTLFVSVMERLREFGILMALGFSPGQLFRLVMWESLWLGLVGLVVGVVVLAWPYHYLSTTGLDMSAMVGEGNAEVAGVAMEPIMYVNIYPINALWIGLAVVLATLLAGLYPAYRAGRVAPVETIRLV